MNSLEQAQVIVCPAVNEAVNINKEFSVEFGSACCITTDLENVKCENMKVCGEYMKANSECLVFKAFE